MGLWDPQFGNQLPLLFYCLVFEGCYIVFFYLVTIICEGVFTLA